MAGIEQRTRRRKVLLLINQQRAPIDGLRRIGPPVGAEGVVFTYLQPTVEC
jgi:hypothetical protein